ncbi:MAG TPA: DUF1801 domain-containing protein [Microscillaceae bacterium]|nr:DUF1801 domain-containing protein [Microscillaceae bacterium]
MQYDVQTPEEYLDVLEQDWRKEKLEAIRALIRTQAPDLTEGIQYKMLSYGQEPVFCLNAQKNYVSLYIGDIQKVDPEGKLLKGVNIGKGCIRFKKTTSVEDSGVEAFIAETFKLWKAGKDVGC